MDFLLIIQARMGSSRLPGKVLLPLGDTVVLDYVVTRCREIPGLIEIVVATSGLPQDDPIADWCKLHKVACFRGSEQDVLSRYLNCAEFYKPDYVIRVTSDCPFIDYEMATEWIDAMRKHPSDILVYRGELPRGLAIEIISFETLLHVDRAGQEPRHREHVTYYAYEHIQLFRSTEVAVPIGVQYPNLRITLDTPEDYALCQAIASAFPGDVTVPSERVVAYLLKHPEISTLNAHIEQKPVT